MSQFNAPVKRSGGGINVYTGLLAAAVLVLLGGVIYMGMTNMKHTDTGNPLKLVE